MDRLNIDPQDVYEDPDDLTCLDSIKAAIEAERDDLERYKEELKRYPKLMKTIHSESSLFRLSDDDLTDFFQGGDFQPPKHRWNGVDALLEAPQNQPANYLLQAPGTAQGGWRLRFITLLPRTKLLGASGWNLSHQTGQRDVYDPFCQQEPEDAGRGNSGKARLSVRGLTQKANPPVTIQVVL
eukprot:7009562-Prymnesium_polylepis.1